MGFNERLVIDTSIHYRIWSILRQRGWHVEKKNVALTRVTSTDVAANTYAIPSGSPYHGKPIVFMDITNLPWSNGIAIKVNGNLVPRTSYVVNHLNGQVTFNAPVSGTVLADMTIGLCHVREGYPDNEWLETHELPVVAWSVQGSTGRAFDIGSALQDRTRMGEITIFGQNEGQTKDLMEDLWRFIVYVPLVDMTEHQYLDFSGELDPGFDYTDQWMDTPTGKAVLRQSSKPRATLLPPRTGDSVKERHRALVAFEVSRVS